MPSRDQSQLLEERRMAVECLGKIDEVLRASLLERMTQCNKPGCKCMKGKKHGPAYYLTVSYAKGKTRQAYVPKDRKKVAEAWIANYRRVREALEEISRINLELLRSKEAIPKSWSRCGRAR
jgi:hypothetical protein